MGHIPRQAVDLQAAFQVLPGLLEFAEVVVDEAYVPHGHAFVSPIADLVGDLDGLVMVVEGFGKVPFHPGNVGRLESGAVWLAQQASSWRTQRAGESRRESPVRPRSRAIRPRMFSARISFRSDPLAWADWRASRAYSCAWVSRDRRRSMKANAP